MRRSKVLSYIVLMIFYASTLQAEYWVWGVKDIDFEDYGLMDNTYKLSAPYVDVRAYSTNAEALTAAAGKTLLVSSAVTISDNTTIPDNVAVFVVQGGSFAVSSGKTLTINGPFLAGFYQVFSGSGTVTFGVDGIKIVYPEWWGIDGTADDVQINAAIDSLPTTTGGGYPLSGNSETTWAGIVQLFGYYSISNPIMTRLGITLAGRGRYTTTIYNANASGLNAVEVVSRIGNQTDTRTVVRDLGITGNANSGNGVYVKNVVRASLLNLHIQFNGANGIFVQATDNVYAPGIQVGLLVENCEVYSNKRWGFLSGDATDTYPSTTIKITNSLFANNGADVSQSDPAGGAKIWFTTAPDVVGSFFEGNFGVGLQISSVAGTYDRNYFEANDGGTKSITAITKANPAVVTYIESGYDFKNGQTISLYGVGGMTQVDNLAFTIANVNTTNHTFELSGINSTAYSTYTSGGQATGINVLFVAEGVGSSQGNTLTDTYLAYGTIHLGSNAYYNVITGTYFSVERPNLIVDASSSYNQLIGTRANTPVLISGSGGLYQISKDKIQTGILVATDSLTAPGMNPGTDNTYSLGLDPGVTGTGPSGFRSLVLTDTTNGKHYKITVINGTLTTTALD